MHNNKLINYVSNRFLSETQASQHLMRSKGTLRNWRGRGTHSDILPAHLTKEGVFYRFEDVLSFDERRRKKHEPHRYPRISVLLNDVSLPDIDPTTLLTTSEAALAFGISKASLQIWRSKWQFLDVLPVNGRSLKTHYLAKDLATFILEGRKYWEAQSIMRDHQYRPRSKRTA